MSCPHYSRRLPWRLNRAMLYPISAVYNDPDKIGQRRIVRFAGEFCLRTSCYNFESLHNVPRILKEPHYPQGNPAPSAMVRYCFMISGTGFGDSFYQFHVVPLIRNDLIRQFTMRSAAPAAFHNSQPIYFCPVFFFLLSATCPPDLQSSTANGTRNFLQPGKKHNPMLAISASMRYNHYAFCGSSSSLWDVPASHVSCELLSFCFSDNHLTLEIIAQPEYIAPDCMTIYSGFMDIINRREGQYRSAPDIISRRFECQFRVALAPIC